MEAHLSSGVEIWMSKVEMPALGHRQTRRNQFAKSLRIVTLSALHMAIVGAKTRSQRLIDAQEMNGYRARKSAFWFLHPQSCTLGAFSRSDAERSS
jgi:hypothetical protein